MLLTDNHLLPIFSEDVNWTHNDTLTKQEQTSSIMEAIVAK